MSRAEADSNNNQDGPGEVQETVVSIRRVAKVVKGGKRFTIAVLLVAGDGKGRVGVGLGKAKEVAEARSKASQAAKRAMIKVHLKEGRTIHHDVIGRFGAGKVVLRSATAGTGIIAGGPMRAVLECLGVHDVVAKSSGSSNPHNMIRATFDAFENLASPKQIADRRNLAVSDIVARRDLA